MRPSFNIEEMEGTYTVKPGKHLFWPASVLSDGNPRGGGGYVVDLSVPYEKEFCRGQEKNLVPAPGLVPDPITWKPALKYLASIGQAPPAKPSPVPTTSPNEYMTENARRVREPSDLPNLDEAEPVRKRGPGRPRKQQTSKKEE